jgi:hypothetical protein
VATTAGAKWTVLSVDNHINHWGSRMSGMVCVTVRLEHQAQGFGTQPWDWTQEFAPVLYAPALGLVFASAWTGEGNVPQSPQAEVGARAQSTTWQRRIFRMAWADVLAPQGRVPEADAAKLRFVVLKRSYAGTSAWEGALPPMTLPKTKDSIELYGNSVLEDEAFLARLSELPKLKESATVDEARLYLADILETLQPIWRHPWENRLDLILERLEPLARMHPALLLQVGSEAPWPMILGRLATAPALRDAILTELPTTPWLGMVVGNRPDWQLLLREKAPLLMSAVPPRDGIFFSESFMAWRDPAHVPWLIQVMEAGLSTELYLYCRSFPEHREAADAAARRGARAAMLKAGPFVGEDNADRVRALALGLRAGLPETLDRVLHLARVSKPEERDVLLMFDWLTEAIGTTGDDIKSTGVQEKHQNWLSDIAALSAADFRFDEEARVWLRIEQPGTAPKTPAPTQR